MFPTSSNNKQALSSLSVATPDDATTPYFLRPDTTPYARYLFYRP
jgi:hypothetical protein